MSIPAFHFTAPSPFIQLTDDNITSFGPQTGNKAVYSKLTRFGVKGRSSGFSMKSVLSGAENYRIDGRSHVVEPGQYLLVNEGQEVDCWFESKGVTEGLCLYFDHNLIADAFNNYQVSDEQLLESNGEVHKEKSYFIDEIYGLNHSGEFGKSINQLANQLSKNQIPNITESDEIFIRLAEQLAASQMEHYRRAAQLPSGKQTTRKELYRRLLIAQATIDARFHDPISLEDIARASALSQFHMLRNYKAAFGITPHQYLMQKRLSHAKQLLAARKSTVSEVAIQSGFSDLHNFSKAFRKSFGASPRKYQHAIAI